MTARHHHLLRRCAMLLFLSIGTTRAEAQSAPCTLLERTDPPGELLTCRDGLVIRTERGSLHRLIDRNRDGHPEGAELTSRGLLIEMEPGRRGSRFQIHTPHAIASVRGTLWAVDVTPARTSVFVQRGAVAVRRQGSRQGVTLRVGEGVDVEGIGGPLEVKRWAPQRAAALLARFGR
jgi:FecR protein